jgi:hypothetical protein
VKLAYLCSRHPLLGGEYYRAMRPGALAAKRFGWETAACTKMATTQDDGGPLSFVTPNDTLITPDVIIIRPIDAWRQHWTDQAHEAGQVVIADLDDDLWKHQEWSDKGEERPNEDHYDEWFWNVDAVLVSTRHLATRVREMGHRSPVLVAPNCYDPYGLDATPSPGRTLGTRLWLSGRMDGDLAMYDELFLPLLEGSDLMFLHVGAEPGHRFSERGWPEGRVIERPSTVIPQLAKSLEGLNIGTICMTEHPYNDAKTETHAVELASMGVPLVAASNHPLYRTIPGRVNPDAESVRGRVTGLLDPTFWHRESLRARRWARDISARSETSHMSALLRVVNLLRSR